MQPEKRAKMSLHEIYQYLGNKNFNLSSEKVLREPQASYDVIWSIMHFLAHNLKDSKYEQIEPTLIYVLADQDIHRGSLKRMKQYITVSEVFKKILRGHADYPIRDILRPEREAVHERLNLLIQANKYLEKFNREHEHIRTEIKLKKNLVQEQKRRLEQRNEQIEEAKSEKEREKPLYEEKLAAIDNLSKDYNYKKKQKLDLTNSNQSLDNEQKKKAKQLEQQKDHTAELNLRIKKLQREVITQAPKIKKDRYMIIEQYERLLSEKNQQSQMDRHKIQSLADSLRPVLGLKQKSKTFKVQSLKKQIDRVRSQMNSLQNNIIQDQQKKYCNSNMKKELLSSITSIDRNKKQLGEAISAEQRQLALLQRNYSTAQDEGAKHAANAKKSEDSNKHSQVQYQKLEDKIKLCASRINQRIFEMGVRIRDMDMESRTIMTEGFADFN